MTILEIKNLEYSYQDKKVITNLNLSIEEGSFTTIIGNNKSGKTTLIKLICGLLDSKNSITIQDNRANTRPLSNNFQFFGVVFSDIENKFLFQDVYQELAFPLENLNLKKEEIEKKIVDIAKEFRNTKLLDKKIEDLTISEKKELLVMISLLHDPKVLVLDHAFSMMNKKTKEKIGRILLEKQKKEKLTIILTTTNLEEIIDSDYTYVIHNGQIIMEGKPLMLLREDKILNRVGLELPFMIDLSQKLKFYELLTEEITDMDRMVNALWK
ncbi:MAG: ABC transporter ATP-binding protein [bacterium]|nr:ABC transporter ATP-binding protein [bacterium]